jgi:hypothetical protein
MVQASKTELMLARIPTTRTSPGGAALRMITQSVTQAEAKSGAAALIPGAIKSEAKPLQQARHLSAPMKWLAYLLMNKSLRSAAETLNGRIGLISHIAMTAHSLQFQHQDRVSKILEIREEVVVPQNELLKD